MSNQAEQVKRHPGAIDPETYQKYFGRKPSRWRTAAKAGGAVMALALVAAAGNMAPRWRGVLLADGTHAEALSLAVVTNGPEDGREMALEHLTRECTEAIQVFVQLTDAEPGALGDKSALRGSRLAELFITELQRLEAGGGTGAKRAKETLEHLQGLFGN